MRYRNGREAKNGDKVVSLGVDGGKIQAVPRTRPPVQSAPKKSKPAKKSKKPKRR